MWDACTTFGPEFWWEVEAPSPWRCESQPGDVETWDPRAFHSFHILPSVIWRIKAVTILLPGWLGGCETIMQSAFGVGLELGGRTNHPATKEMELTILWIHMDTWSDFFPRREFSMFHFGGFLYGKTTALLGWHETYGVPFGQNKGWRSGTVNNYSAEININKYWASWMTTITVSLTVDYID